MTPKDAPRPDRISSVLKQWSHYAFMSTLHVPHVLFSCSSCLTFSFNNASLIGRLDRAGGGTTALLLELESAMVADVSRSCPANK